jgi:integrase
MSKERYRTGRDSLTTAQVASLLEAFSRPWEKALIHLAIAAGLRRTDLVALKRNDFYPDTGRLTYYEKKKRRTRSITIPSPAAIQDLKMHLNTSRKSEWMFPSPLNGPTFKKSHISDRQAYDLFNEHLDQIGIRRRPFPASGPPASSFARRPAGPMSRQPSWWVIASGLFRSTTAPPQTRKWPR